MTDDEIFFLVMSFVNMAIAIFALRGWSRALDLARKTSEGWGKTIREYGNVVWLLEQEKQKNKEDIKNE